ncbi:MAG: hypothetical protein KDH96_11925 [Candidatus Riesia sp.]|nr:hypothetical protein [Candidatus Riesia sp.]
MTNKRIRDLDLQSTPNEDDSIPVDHSSYMETKSYLLCNWSFYVKNYII